MEAERSTGAAPGATSRSERSCPAQKPRPAPVSSTARTASSSAARSRAARNSRCIAGLKLLSLSGRWSVTCSTPPSCETRIDDMGTAYNFPRGKNMPDRALLIIDIQNDYFPGGAMELEGADAAGANAARAVAAFRKDGIPVFHVRHLSVRPGSTFFL